MAGVVGVVPGGGAVARRGARHRVQIGLPAGVERRQPGDLLRGAPGAGGLGDYERLRLVRAVGVVPGGGAVARRAARQPFRAGLPAGVERAQPADLLCGAPGAGGLVDDERLLIEGAVEVEPAGGAIAGRAARQRFDQRQRAGLDADTGHLPGPPPAAVVLADDERARRARLARAAGGVVPSGAAVAGRPARHLLEADPGIAAGVELH